MQISKPKLYHDLSSWWHLLSPPSDYAEEAALYERTLLGACTFPAATLLELGSGGGNNASYMKKRFSITLVDISPHMLNVSRKLNPECEHIEGDMRTFRLTRTFDSVFVHDSVSYITSKDDLQKVIQTAYIHCNPGGAALFVPDYIRETFKPSTGHGGSDGENRGIRYLEWTWDPDPADDTLIVDVAYILRENDGSVTIEYDRHLVGLFSRADWLQLLSDAGFRPESVPLELSDLEPGSHEMFVARKPEVQYNPTRRKRL